jgi:hypothetical protein
MKKIALLLVLLISLSNEYQYELVDDQFGLEDEPNLQFNILGFIKGLIVNQINNLKNPNWWLDKLKNKFTDFVKKQVLSRNRINNVDQFGEAVQNCDRRHNKDLNEEVIKLRKEIGLPVNTMEWCRNNKQCGTTIKTDYDYLDVIIYKLPPYNPMSEMNRWRADGSVTVIPRLGPAVVAKRPSNDPKYLADRAKVDKMRGMVDQLQNNLNRCLDDPFW